MDDNSADMEITDDIVHLPSMVDNSGFDSSPVTPYSNKESSELMSCFTSSMTLVSCMNDIKNKDSVLGGSRTYAARRLSFNSVKTQNGCEKPLGDADMLLSEAVYDSLLECIISDFVGEISAVGSCSGALMTPRFAPRLTEICPGPPLKSVKKARNIDLSLCRKLEFDVEV